MDHPGIGPSNQTWVFEWANTTWTQVGDMHYQRQNPLCTNLPDGRIIVSGKVTKAFSTFASILSKEGLVQRLKVHPLPQPYPHFSITKHLEKSDGETLDNYTIIDFKTIFLIERSLT